MTSPDANFATPRIAAGALFIDSDRVLLVFDPSFAVAEVLRQLRSGRVHRSKIDTLMAAFRQDGAHLTRWKEYEIMM